MSPLSGGGGSALISRGSSGVHSLYGAQTPGGGSGSGLGLILSGSRTPGGGLLFPLTPTTSDAAAATAAAVGSPYAVAAAAATAVGTLARSGPASCYHSNPC